MHHHIPGLGRGVLMAIKSMPPLPHPKNPYAAFAAGLFGAIGNGLYLRSWKDFGLSLTLNVGLMVLIPGVGLVPSLFLSACYGFLRVKYSNEKLAGLLPGRDDDKLPPPNATAEIITLAPKSAPVAA